MNEEERKPLIEEVLKLKRRYKRNLIISSVLYLIGIILIIIVSVFYDQEYAGYLPAIGFVFVGLYPLIYAFKAGKEVDKEYTSNHYVLEISGNRAIIRNETSFAARIICSLLGFVFGMFITPIMIIVWIVKLRRCSKVLEEIINDEEEDYEKKDILDVLLDKDNCEPITLTGEDNKETEFEQLSVIPYQDKIYCILKPLTRLDELKNINAPIVFRVDEKTSGEHYLSLEENVETAQIIYLKYLKLIKESESNNS